MVSEKLNEGNFLVYAMHHYDNPQCNTLQEFEEDIKKFLYLKKNNVNSFIEELHLYFKKDLYEIIIIQSTERSSIDIQIKILYL